MCKFIKLIRFFLSPHIPPPDNLASKDHWAVIPLTSPLASPLASVGASPEPFGAYSSAESSVSSLPVPEAIRHVTPAPSLPAPDSNRHVVPASSRHLPHDHPVIATSHLVANALHTQTPTSTRTAATTATASTAAATAAAAAAAADDETRLTRRRNQRRLLRTVSHENGANPDLS